MEIIKDDIFLFSSSNLGVIQSREPDQKHEGIYKAQVSKVKSISMPDCMIVTIYGIADTGEYSRSVFVTEATFTDILVSFSATKHT
jgi:hypothetical protein